MFTVVPSKRFRRQVKLLVKSDPQLLKKLQSTIELLRIKQSLPISQKDHKLLGRLQGFRECHIIPDWLLIYRQHNNLLILELIATGTHSTLFD